MYFDEIEIIKVNELLSDKFKYYAHLGSKKSNNKEELFDHTKLCLRYFNKLVKEKNIDLVLRNFERLYLGGLSLEAIKLFKELFINTITLHDMGKINPIFQSRKMDNESIKFDEKFCAVDTKHSIVSSVLYIDYFWNKVMTYPAQEKKILRTFMFLNSYIISKHHGSLDEFVKYIDKFDEGEVGFKVIDIFTNTYKEIYIKGFNLEESKVKTQCKNTKKVLKKCNREESIYLYTYGKLLYSLLLASDYYSTTEFMNGVEMKTFGGLDDVYEFYDIYKRTDVIKSIRNYEEKQYGSKKLDNISDINILRNEMFLDAEKVLIDHIDENIFFLEAPTGSGKSNVSMNLSFKLIEKEPTLKKIYNIYPFNTLVEQNLESFTKIFECNEKILNNIAVVNSIYPIKTDKYEEESNEDFYSKSLLDRQFLNYPIVLTTHVSIFDTMFGASKESSFGFHQLANSVIILDEIQSYKNVIWTEIISFLKGFSKILNMKVIIMSATLPNLNLLLKSKENTINLIRDREKYFSNPLFKDRVKVSYELMDKENILDELYTHVKKSS
ncbi:CRISPR-associated endonuclease Cas3'' [Clostridium cibarium]|uniref:CRISPR-associated endonuclease Cas3 n=1 Tax=Clostridium cibarium TaxID=2762247 RepID=A0ABR8PVY6_9CLOT|nr:CRISPR-associated endonuclease Cas3'' [Clostridium cibarium]MBD7912307.1 CRISPR-associated endonuclease Cas3'' [Clostridium cibarium]